MSRIRAGDGCVRVGGNCLKYLKRGWNSKEGTGNKDLKEGAKLGQGGGDLKGEGVEPPHQLWTIDKLL